MKAKTFNATIFSGHKEDAVEVPFDPARQWKLKTRSIRTGRRGFAVRAKIGNETFDSFVVARVKKFWLLLPTTVAKKLKIEAGDNIRVTLAPPRND